MKMLMQMEGNMHYNNSLYISDLDGTLLNQFAELSEYTKKTLNSMIAKGLNFSIATARSLKPAQEMLSDVNLNIPIVLMNGVLIYDIKQERYLKINKITSSDSAAIVRTIREYEVTAFMCELNTREHKTYCETFAQNPPNDYVKKRIDSYCPDSRGFSNPSFENVIHFTIIDTYERLQPIYEILSNQPDLNRTFFKNIYSPDWYLQICSANASKQTAVDLLRKKYKFEHIFGFGDNQNDLPLFAACDTRIAVENATPDIKDNADFICGTNDSDGVAKWLEQNANQ